MDAFLKAGERPGLDRISVTEIEHKKCIMLMATQGLPLTYFTDWGGGGGGGGVGRYFWSEI